MCSLKKRIMLANKMNVITVARWTQGYDGDRLSEEELITDLPDVHLEHESSWAQYEPRRLKTSNRDRIQVLRDIQFKSKIHLRKMSTGRTTREIPGQRIFWAETPGRIQIFFSYAVE